MTQKKRSDYSKASKILSFMEVCGTHTVAIARSGIKDLLPSNINLISGPGCPVCVTPTGEIDTAIEAAKMKDVVLMSFGDMLRVPGSTSSLEKEKAKGAEVEIVYSPLDSVAAAAKDPGKEFVFMGVGFETTSPTVAAAVIEAKKNNIKNFSVISAFKLIPPALKLLVDDKDIKIDGFLLPGHVSAIIGTIPYEFIGIPGVVAGFDPEDIMESVRMLIEQVEQGDSKIEIQYDRVVKKAGNPAAVKLLYTVFEECDSSWRGIGKIKDSGLGFRKEFSGFDAMKKLGLKAKETKEPAGCLCGQVLKGMMTPADCKLFGKTCTPENPVGPCMVSSEGTCGAHYRYDRERLGAR